MKGLANRYRPKNFDELIGQQNAVRIVKGLIKNKSLTSRGLFLYGPTGVGKTSLARIIAHHMNCEHYDLENCAVCHKCDFCLQVAAGNDPAVDELNFSSTRGIDTMRAVIDSLEFVPQYKARVVIMDEMHNMTKDAANAFLTTLEEPPENTLFILITTDPEKVRQTVRDRCVSIPFARVKPDVQIAHLQEIAAKEGASLPPYAFSYIAKSSDGIMRQALASMEVLITILKEDPTADVSNHHFLEEKLESDGSSPSLIANYLIGGIYSGSYGKTLPALARILGASNFNARYFADRLYEYHQNTFHCLIDPARTQKVLFNDYYADWYATLEQVVKKKGTLNLTVSSGEVLYDLIMEMAGRLGAFEAEPNKVIMLYTIRMVRAVKENNQTAYTKQSPFHAKHAAELCV